MTVFCTLDNEGILSENAPCVQHVVLLERASADVAVGPPDSAKTVVLDVIPEPGTNNGIVFEGTAKCVDQNLNSLFRHSPCFLAVLPGEWRSHAKALKPLGLSCLLLTSCARRTAITVTRKSAVSVAAPWVEQGETSYCELCRVDS